MRRQRHLMSLLVMGATISISWAIADDKPAAQAPAGTESFAALKAEFDSAIKKWSEGAQKEFEAAEKAGTARSFRPSQENPTPGYSPRFLAIADKDPQGPSAFDALRYTLNTSGGPKGKAGTWSKAVKILREHYVTRPGPERVVAVVARHNDAESDQFVRDVIAKNPDRAIQAKAYRALLNAREQPVMVAEQIKTNEEIRTRVEKHSGKDRVQQFLADGVKAKTEADELRAAYAEKYHDLIADLSVGRPMPPLVSEDLEGKTVSLADLKGKVVVFDIWATWCGPCKAMIPHEREMVERLKDKPFALVSISFDAEKKTLVDFLAKEKMPWAHWWNGHEGKLLDTLNIQHYPTIFVVDPDGVIRFKEIRGESLEKAVNQLLEDAKNKPAKAA
jgi:thiol-disulfide isomerase/thioredoxin